MSPNSRGTLQGDGTTCKPKENFEFCNKRTGDPWVPLTENGQLDPAYVTSSGMSVGNIIIICVVVILFSTLTAYGVYRFQRRSHVGAMSLTGLPGQPLAINPVFMCLQQMDAEIRAIMAQYMPLDKENEENGQSRRSAAAISGATAHQRSPDRSGRMV